MLSSGVCPYRATGNSRRGQQQCSQATPSRPLPPRKNRSVATQVSSNNQQGQLCIAPVFCQAFIHQSVQKSSLSSLAQHRLSSSAAVQPFSAAPVPQLRAKGRQAQCGQAASASASAAAGLLTSESSSGSMPSSPPVQQVSKAPVGPQRAATQRGAASQPQAALAAAALAAPCVTLQQEQQQHPRQQEVSSMHANVWMPDKQLWVPHSAAAMADSHNPLSSRQSSSEVTLTRVFSASSATAGRKARMEDRHVVAALDPEHGVATDRTAVTVQEAVSLAAVFDGHAGDATATYAARHIPQLLHSALSGRHCSSNGGPAPAASRGLMTPRSAMETVFTQFDHWWDNARCDPKLTQHGWDDSGSTAVISMVSGQQLVVANTGDSVALMAHNGTSRRLTEEHRLDNEAEAARVREAGGRVVRTRPGGAARVMGTSTQTRYKGSMVTRSLGDFAFKSPQPLISAQPFVNTHLLQPTDKLVLLTCDGVTDVLPDDDMLDIGLSAIAQARNCTNNGNVLAKAAAQAVMEAALHKGSTDNITVVAMLMDWGCEYDEDS